MQHIENIIFNISNDQDFSDTALTLFHVQAQHNPVYKQYLSYLGISPSSVSLVADIPCLPVSVFKTHRVKTGNFKPDICFESSGTENSSRSLHYIKNAVHYQKSLTKCFEFFYGKPAKYAIFALLPSYLERKNASLVYMAKTLMAQNPDKHGGFYLQHNAELNKSIHKSLQAGYQPVLLAVSFALLDMADNANVDLSDTIIIETGGMKGLKKEIIRDELYRYLTKKLKPKTIHSEYGMTEMLSQAYKTNTTGFLSPPWLKVLIRDMHDPATYLPKGQKGLINIIDLANIHSCAFLQTSDIGEITSDGFTVSGRLDYSDIRGCNFII
jgi:hypothetical protein